MVFSSASFLFLFLPILFIVYTVIPSLKAQNVLLTVASLIFYAFGEPVFVFLMIGSVYVNYLLARGVVRFPDYGKFIVGISVVWNLGIIGVFKYSGFIASVITSWTGITIDLPRIPVPGVGSVVLGSVMPIGISFFTFQILSYVIDVYREPEILEKNFGKVLLYISFFPQLIAGPIVKYHDVRQYISDRRQEPDEVIRGIRRFIVGMGKKLFLANTMGEMAAVVFNADTGVLSVPLVWLGAVCYTLEIFFDFSGYSDMAIGLGHMFGFTFKENFNHPYISTGMKEFWRRWHISLSTWFKEYLYIPLGGNRKGKTRTMINKLIVFFCTGFWHGASWNFIVWGMVHGLSMVFEDALDLKDRLAKHRWIGWIYTMLIVTCAFVLFNAGTLTHAGAMLAKMFAGPMATPEASAMLAKVLTPYHIFMFILSIIGCLPVADICRHCIEEYFPDKKETCHALTYLLAMVLLVLCIFNLANASYNPFIYFRF